MRTQGIKVQDDAAMKVMLHRIVAMLTRMVMKFDGVAESSTEYEVEIDYEHRCAEHEHEHRCAEHEHRCAEHEHESQNEATSEPSD